MQHQIQSKIYLTFTFQYGDIQIYKYKSKRYWTKKFTFQSGDIQILDIKIVVKALEKFTFQSGDIRIEFK